MISSLALIFLQKESRVYLVRSLCYKNSCFSLINFISSAESCRKPAQYPTTNYSCFSTFLKTTHIYRVHQEFYVYIFASDIFILMDVMSVRNPRWLNGFSKRFFCFISRSWCPQPNRKFRAVLNHLTEAYSHCDMDHGNEDLQSPQCRREEE